MSIPKIVCVVIFIFCITVVINIIDEIISGVRGARLKRYSVWRRVVRRSLYMTFGVLMLISIIFFN